MSNMLLSTQVDKKGRKFELFGDIPALMLFLAVYANHQETAEDLANLTTPDWDFDEMSIYGCDDAAQWSYRSNGDNPDMVKMADQRKYDQQHAKDLMTLLETSNTETLGKWLADQPRKKDGTLHKNRISTIMSLSTFCSYYEDSYGWYGPMIKIRNVDDFKAEIEFTDNDCVEKR